MQPSNTPPDSPDKGKKNPGLFSGALIVLFIGVVFGGLSLLASCLIYGGCTTDGIIGAAEYVSYPVIGLILLILVGIWRFLTRPFKNFSAQKWLDFAGESGWTGEMRWFEGRNDKYPHIVGIYKDIKFSASLLPYNTEIEGLDGAPRQRYLLSIQLASASDHELSLFVSKGTQAPKTLEDSQVGIERVINQVIPFAYTVKSKPERLGFELFSKSNFIVKMPIRLRKGQWSLAVVPTKTNQPDLPESILVLDLIEKTIASDPSFLVELLKYLSEEVEKTCCEFRTDPLRDKDYFVTPE
jgi:hypothetical protein